LAAFLDRPSIFQRIKDLHHGYRYKKKKHQLQRFEEWDRDYKKTLSLEEKLHQFGILYYAGYDLFSRKLEDLHTHHLKALIEVQRQYRLRIRNKDKVARKKDKG